MSHASRRNFLKLGAAAFAGATLGGSARLSSLFAADAPAGAGGASSEYGGLRMGIQSYSLRDRSLEKALDAMKNDLKLGAIEIYPNHLVGKSPAQWKELLAAAGVTAVSYGVVGFGKKHEDNKKLFELAKAYGMTNLSCNPDPDPACFDSLEKLTEEYGITVGIHPHGPEDKKWGKIEQLQKGFEGRSNRIGLCNDTGHLIRSGEDPLKACELFKDRLHAFHLKDFKKDEKGKWHDVPAGTASLDVDGIVKFLLKNNFKGGVFIEYEGGKPVESIQQSLARVKEAVAKAKG